MGHSEPLPRPRAYRAAVRSFLSVCLLSGGALLGLLHAYDPLMLFHPPWGRSLHLHESMRLQAAGIINNTSFDGLILGTSMTENTSAREAERLLGGRFVNLSVTASDYFERSLLLRHALRRQALRQVVYSLDAGVVGREGHPIFHREAFDFLYDWNPVNDFRAYLTPKFLECALQWSSSTDCIGRAVELDRPNAWFELPEQAIRFGGLDNWFRARNDWQVKAALAAIAADGQRAAAGERQQLDEAARRKLVEEVEDYADRYLLSFVRSNPQVQFRFFFPPYSRIRFAQWHQLGLPLAVQHEAMVRYLVRRAEEFDNLQLFGFEGEDFIDDIAWYKDTAHYREQIDSLILQAMAAGAHQLQAADVEDYLARARRKALEFDLPGLGARIESYLQQQGEGEGEGGLAAPPLERR